MGKLKPFGKDSAANDMGYDLPFLIGWLEDILSSEEDATGRRAKLLEKAEEAHQLLCDIDAEAPQKDNS